MDLGTQRVKAVVLKDDEVTCERTSASLDLTQPKLLNKQLTKPLKQANLKLSDISIFCCNRFRNGYGALC